tara:strand:+ start:12288 stop:12506 length:219 start_codon:yes stop_codon:yes gene_type:complete
MKKIQKLIPWVGKIWVKNIKALRKSITGNNYFEIFVMLMFAYHACGFLDLAKKHMVIQGYVQIRFLYRDRGT